jgi:hypothetical protein
MADRANRSRLSAAAAMLVTLAFSSRSSADTATTTALAQVHANGRTTGPSEAEALIRQALELRRAGRDSQAYPLLQKAYEAQTSPRTAVQLGLVEMQLGYWLEAERHLMEGLASPRDPWVFGNRAVIEASLATAKAAIGEIVVTGAPAGAVVLVNGREAGRLPSTTPIRAAEGPANVELRAFGYQTLLRSLTIVGGRREELSVVMQAAAPGPESSGAGERARGAGSPLGVSKEQRTASSARRGSTGWRWAGLALGSAGGVSATAGIVHLLRGREACDEVPAGFVCNNTRRSSLLGWALVGAGLTAGLGGTVLFLQNREVQVGLALGEGSMLVLSGRL